MKSIEEVKLMIAELAQLQSMLVHTEVMLDDTKYKVKELRYEIRQTVDGDLQNERRV